MGRHLYCILTEKKLSCTNSYEFFFALFFFIIRAFMIEINQAVNEDDDDEVNFTTTSVKETCYGSCVVKHFLCIN